MRGEYCLRRMCSRYWSSSFFPCGDDVGLGGFCIFLPLSAGDCIITLCNLQGVIQRNCCYVLHLGCYTARCINSSWLAGDNYFIGKII